MTLKPWCSEFAVVGRVESERCHLCPRCFLSPTKAYGGDKPLLV